tara:strand:+ start:85 stop:297 length:213 start_codon:yes stop_codon:yes gene_type:complete
MEEVELANLDIVDKVVLLDMEIQDKRKLAIPAPLVEAAEAAEVAVAEVEVGATTAAMAFRDLQEKMVNLD